MSTPHFSRLVFGPRSPGRERLWDGQSWTQHLRKAAGHSAGLSPRAIAVAIWKQCAWADPYRRAVASGSDRDATEAAPQAPASSPDAQSTSPPTTPTPRLAKVPVVKGLSLTTAKRTLRAAGLEVGDIDHRPSRKRKDTVLKQGVDKGIKLEPGSSVDLVVAAPQGIYG
jgi:hypothetical protein